MIPASPFVAALNHLLAPEPWARERLAPFAGRVLELRAPPLPPLRLAVLADGRVGPSPPGVEPSLTVTAGAGTLAAALQGEEAMLRAIEVAGDTDFGAALVFLMRHLRWDAEEDLSALVGDAAAHRVARAARTAAAWHAEAARRLAEGVIEWALHERGLLVGRAEMERLAAGTARLRDALERLDKRLEGLGG